MCIQHATGDQRLLARRIIALFVRTLPRAPRREVSIRAATASGINQTNHSSNCGRPCTTQPSNEERPDNLTILLVHLHSGLTFDTSIFHWPLAGLYVADVRCNLEIGSMYPEFSGFECSCPVTSLQHSTEGSAEVVVRLDKDDFS
nr:hypothetical transcript [Hymenolepis microstoma]